MNGLDLFTGIGGITLALNEWVRPVCYVELDRYAQGVLLSRMRSGDLPTAPIWDDVRTLRSELLDIPIDVIYGGFPCQDISIAGTGKGLAGERSGLFYEIIRLTKELQPTFVFLENVPTIRTRGLTEVVSEFTNIGYDTRWTCVSAEEVGAPHLRKRWFLLAHNNRKSNRDERKDVEPRDEQVGQGNTFSLHDGSTESMAYSNSVRWSEGECRSEKGEREPHSPVSSGEVEHTDDTRRKQQRRKGSARTKTPPFECSSWWEVEPSVGRVVDGLPNRMDRLTCLGNSVVPKQAKEAFKRLMGVV